MMTPFLLARCSFLRWVIKKYIKLNSLILEMFLFLSYYNICRAEKRMDFFLTFNLCFEIMRLMWLTDRSHSIDLNSQVHGVDQ